MIDVLKSLALQTFLRFSKNSGVP